MFISLPSAEIPGEVVGINVNSIESIFPASPTTSVVYTGRTASTIDLSVQDVLRRIDDCLRNIAINSQVEEWDEQDMYCYPERDEC